MDILSEKKQSTNTLFDSMFDEICFQQFSIFEVMAFAKQPASHYLIPRI